MKICGADTHRHVTPGSNKRISHRVNQLPRNPKITNLDFSSAVDEDVAWFNITVNDLMLVSQVAQSFQNLQTVICSLLWSEYNEHIH